MVCLFSPLLAVVNGVMNVSKVSLRTDGMIERSHRVFALQDASVRDIGSIQNWIEGTGCVAREETAFLEREDDLVNLASPRDYAIASLEPVIETIVMYLCKWFKRVSRLPTSPNLSQRVIPCAHFHAASACPVSALRCPR